MYNRILQYYIIKMFLKRNFFDREYFLTLATTTTIVTDVCEPFRPNQVLLRNMVLQKTWMVEIDINLNATNPDMSMNVLQLQKQNEDLSPATGQHGIKTPQGNFDFNFKCQKLSRILVVVLRNSNRLRICSSVGDNINYCYFWQGFDLNEWFSLRISQERDDSGVNSENFIPKNKLILGHILQNSD